MGTSSLESLKTRKTDMISVGKGGLYSLDPKDYVSGISQVLLT